MRDPRLMTRVAEAYCDTALGPYANIGFRLDQHDEETLDLTFKGAAVRCFPRHSVSIRAIRGACWEYISTVNRDLGMVRG